MPDWKSAVTSPVTDAVAELELRVKALNDQVTVLHGLGVDVSLMQSSIRTIDLGKNRSSQPVLIAQVYLNLGSGGFAAEDLPQAKT